MNTNHERALQRLPSLGGTRGEAPNQYTPNRPVIPIKRGLSSGQDSPRYARITQFNVYEPRAANLTNTATRQSVPVRLKKEGCPHWNGTAQGDTAPQCGSGQITNVLTVDFVSAKKRAANEEKTAREGGSFTTAPLDGEAAKP